jgi:hypothetical protein
MRIKSLTVTASLTLFLLAMPPIVLAQKSGEAQSVFFGAGDRTTLRFANNDPKQNHCGSFITHTPAGDNREDVIALRVGHMHVAGYYFFASVQEVGWLYMTPSRIVFRVEEGDASHSFDIPRTVIREKEPFEEIYDKYEGIQINLKEKLLGSKSDEQKFVFILAGGKGCHRMKTSPYKHFIQRTVTDFDGAVAEFKRVADSLKQSGRIQEAPASMIPSSNAGGMTAPPATPSRRVLRHLHQIDSRAVCGHSGQDSEFSGGRAISGNVPLEWFSKCVRFSGPDLPSDVRELAGWRRSRVLTDAPSQRRSFHYGR